MSLHDDLLRLREHLTRRSDSSTDDAVAWSIFATTRLDPHRTMALLAVLGPKIGEATHDDALRVIDSALQTQGAE